jgi:hypothetical protein
MTDTAPAQRTITTYAAFWPYYLREHAKPETRAVHFVGTAIATTCIAALAVTGQVWFALGALVGGYGPAWIGHFFIEKNRPATFTYPLWSLASDYRMAWLWLTGRLQKELVQAGVRNPLTTR